MEQEQELVRLKCVKEGSKLRMKIISVGYSSEANCQCPRDIRTANQEYTVPKEDISLANTRGKFFYRIKKGRIVPYNSSLEVDIKNLKIYGDDGNTECCICLEDNQLLVILANCGHYCCCNGCAKNLKQCPLCRSNIIQIVTRDQLQ
jgi:hypothetical protein